MTEREQLLAAILDCPADTTARLVYADLLDELGGARNAARAELIRVQCELDRTPERLWEKGDFLGRDAKMKLVPYTPDDTTILVGVAFEPGPPDPRRAELRDRETAILKTWGVGWLPKITRKVANGRTSHNVPVNTIDFRGATIACGLDTNLAYTFRRGFVADLRAELPLPIPGSGPRPCLQYIYSLLPAHPTETFTFAVVNYEPEVKITVRKAPGVWFARLDVDEETVETSAFKSRQELVNALPPFLARELSQIEFERITDHDDFGDDGDQGYGHTHW